MSSLYIKRYNHIYRVGDCIEFKRYTPSNIPDIPDISEYTITNGKIVSNNNPNLLEVKIYDQISKKFIDNYIRVIPESITYHYPKEKITQLTPRIVIKDIWKDLVFREIKIVKAKDQQSVTYDYINDEGFIRTEQFSSIENAFSHIDINKTGNIYTHYQDYYGFTSHQALRNNDIYSNQEIFFSRKCYCELNLTGGFITGNFSLRKGFKTIPPQDKQYVCGLPEIGEKGVFYRRWFVCTKEFLTLWTMICEPDHYSLKNKIDDSYVTKNFDELLEELNTIDYCLPFQDNVSISNLKENYSSYNIEAVALYIPNIYQTIAKALFKPSKRNNLDIYPSYEERFREDLVWMKKSLYDII
jgi:hypothetical protein